MGELGNESIEKLRNLGPQSASWLRDSGITTIGELENVGAVAAFQIVRTRGFPASLNLLYALHAGLSQRDWRDLTPAEKSDLKSQLEGLA